MAEVYQGSCLCAKVRFELIGAPQAVSHCHCSQCQKGHGALFASYGSVPRSALRVSIALGTLDTPFIPHKQKHVHADTAALWYTPVSD
ncbi:GFA family protein [Pseudomonas sp.]|nr:GFA family protein [Pseudomonas sp.]